MHRIYWLDMQIREGRYPNSNLLARQFEISRRQAQRDIEYLVVSLQAPLVYIAKKRGYAYEDTAYVLPQIYLTEAEKQVLKYLAHRYRNYNYDHSGTINRVARLLDRFTEGEQPGRMERLPVFDSSPQAVETMELLSYAITESFAVQALYSGSSGGELERRLLYPLRLESRYNADYIHVYCTAEDKQLSIRLDAIRELVVTKQKFAYTEEAEVRPSEGDRLRHKPYIARIILAQELHSDRWNGYRICSIDGLAYEIEFHDIESFMIHLMNSEWQELQSPNWLKRRLELKCSEILGRLAAREE